MRSELRISIQIAVEALVQAELEVERATVRKRDAECKLDEALTRVDTMARAAQEEETT